MCAPYNVTENLKMMGIDLGLYPEIKPCSCVALHGPSIGISLSERAMLWRLWCDCGKATSDRTTLLDAINEWLEINGHPTTQRSDGNAT